MRAQGRTDSEVQFLLDAKHLLLPCRQAKDAENMMLIDHANLNMRAIVKPSVFVKLAAFDKQGSDCLIGQHCRVGFPHLVPRSMKVLDYSAVEIALAFLASLIFGERLIRQLV
jgi:hypothetical protein